MPRRASKQPAGSNRYRRLRGVVTAAEWDDEDRVIGLTLVTDDDEEYWIDTYGKGEALLELQDSYVEVSGVIHNDDGEYTVTVKRFREVTDDDDADDDDDVVGPPARAPRRGGRRGADQQDADD